MRKRKRDRFTFEVEGDPETDEILGVRINGEITQGEEYFVVVLSRDGERAHSFCAARAPEESRLLDFVRPFLGQCQSGLEGGAAHSECILCGAPVDLKPPRPARPAPSRKQPQAARVRANLRVVPNRTEPSQRTPPFTKKM